MRPQARGSVWTPQLWDPRETGPGEVKHKAKRVGKTWPRPAGATGHRAVRGGVLSRGRVRIHNYGQLGKGGAWCLKHPGHRRAQFIMRTNSNVGISGPNPCDTQAEFVWLSRCWPHAGKCVWEAWRGSQSAGCGAAPQTQSPLTVRQRYMVLRASY
jgi:hypothetical protein